MAKSKKKSATSKVDSCTIPANVCFGNTDPNAEPYEWESWGFVIRHLRDLVCMDQTAFGRLVRGYTRGQIARYETEQTEPPLDFWIKLMRVFGLNISWALTGKGKPYIEDYTESEERTRFWRWEDLRTEQKNFLEQLSGWDQKKFLR